MRPSPKPCLPRIPRVISPFVAAELDYMILLRDYGREGQLTFLNEVKRGGVRTGALLHGRLRACTLMDEYST